MIWRNWQFERTLAKRLAVYDERNRASTGWKLIYGLLDLPFQVASFCAVGGIGLVRAAYTLIFIGAQFAFIYPYLRTIRADRALIVVAVWAWCAMAFRIIRAWAPRSKEIRLLPIANGKIWRGQTYEFLGSAGFVFVEFLVAYSMIASVSQHPINSLAGALVPAVFQAIVFISSALLLVALRINPALPGMISIVLYMLIVIGVKHPDLALAPSFWSAVNRWNPFGWLNTVYLSWMSGRSDELKQAALVAGIVATLPVSLRAFRRMQGQGLIPLLKNPAPLRLIMGRREQTEPAADSPNLLPGAKTRDFFDLGGKDVGLIARIIGRFLSAKEFVIADALHSKAGRWSRCLVVYLVSWVGFLGMTIFIRRIGANSIEDLTTHLGSSEASIFSFAWAFLFVLMLFSALGQLLFWCPLEVWSHPSRAEASHNPAFQLTSRQEQRTRMYRLFPLTIWEAGRAAVKINYSAFLLLILPSLLLPRIFVAGFLPFVEGRNCYLLTKILTIAFCLGVIGQASIVNACHNVRLSFSWLVRTLLGVGATLGVLGALGFGFVFFQGVLLSVGFGVLLLSAAAGLFWYAAHKYLRKC